MSKYGTQPHKACIRFKQMKLQILHFNSKLQELSTFK